MEFYVFANERKKVLNRWDYISIVMLPHHSAREFLDDLMAAGNKIGYDHEFKFANINRNAIGEKMQLALFWVDLLLEDALARKKRVYFHSWPLGLLAFLLYVLLI